MGKISEMLPADPLAGSEMVEVVQNGKNRRTTPNAIGERIYQSLPERITTHLNTSNDTIDLGTLSE